jgi:hypothetical protein
MCQELVAARGEVAGDGELLEYVARVLLTRERLHYRSGGRRRQHRAPEERIDVRQPLRSLAPRRFEWRAAAALAQSRWVPPGHLRPVAIVFTRVVCDPKTRQLIERQTKEAGPSRMPSAASSTRSLEKRSRRSQGHNAHLTVQRSTGREQESNRHLGVLRSVALVTDNFLSFSQAAFQSVVEQATTLTGGIRE